MAARAKTTRAKPTASERRRYPKRKYSHDFKPSPGDPAKDPATWGAEYKMNRIPVAFWRSVQAKAKREGVSLRGLLLTYLQDWLSDDARAA